MSAPVSARFGRRLRVSTARLQRRTAAALGVSWAHRTDTVVTMLVSNARRAPGYWIQLLLAMGIATFGLILNSTAVVIGAMLVSPLMGPIVELGMGFAVGSSLLTIRAGFRVLQSAAAVVAGAALVTVLLPFHEVTGEIAARTTPTVLDLLVAVCCALTAAYTTVRPGADTTAAAAGTAVGIALVPPLCVVGYGVGTRTPEVAAGAGLLFTANFSAIVVFAVASFLLLGYNRVDAARLERDHLERDTSDAERAAERVHRALGRVFGSRYGLAMRLGIPALFLGAVYVPLSRALDEVAWQVRARGAVRRVLAAEAPRAVQTELAIERGAATLRLLILGSADSAARLERRLTERIAAAGVRAPAVRVRAVADARALATAVASAQRDARSEPAERAPAVAPLTDRLGAWLGARWPASAGPLLSWSVELSPARPGVLTVRHLGPPLGPAAETLLAAGISEALDTEVRVTAVALPADPLVATRGAEAAWLTRAAAVLRAAGETPGTAVCVSAPASRGARARRQSARIRGALDTSVVARQGRLFVEPGPAWSLRVADGGCAVRDGRGPVAPRPGWAAVQLESSR